MYAVGMISPSSAFQVYVLPNRRDPAANHCETIRFKSHGDEHQKELQEQLLLKIVLDSTKGLDELLQLRNQAADQFQHAAVQFQHEEDFSPRDPIIIAAYANSISVFTFLEKRTTWTPEVLTAFFSKVALIDKKYHKTFLNRLFSEDVKDPWEIVQKVLSIFYSNFERIPQKLKFFLPPFRKVIKERVEEEDKQRFSLLEIHIPVKPLVEIIMEYAPSITIPESVEQAFISKPVKHKIDLDNRR
jgi:hypothetical protein